MTDLVIRATLLLYCNKKNPSGNILPGIVRPIFAEGYEESDMLNNWSIICGALPWIAHHAASLVNLWRQDNFPPISIGRRHNDSVCQNHFERLNITGELSFDKRLICGCIGASRFPSGFPLGVCRQWSGMYLTQYTPPLGSVLLHPGSRQCTAIFKIKSGNPSLQCDEYWHNLTVLKSILSW